jgi:flagellar hook-length control protein FliK
VTVSAQSSNSNNESLLQQNAQPTGLQNTLGVKTVTVNLPSNPASQSEAIAKEIQNLLNKNQVANNNGTLKLVLKLFPENLGQIRIEVAQQNGVMTARLLASTAAGKELLDSNLNQLKATFVSQNIQMERIDITQSLQDPEKNYKEQGMFKQFFNQREEDDQESDAESDEEQKTFSEFLEEEVQ